MVFERVDFDSKKKYVGMSDKEIEIGRASCRERV